MEAGRSRKKQEGRKSEAERRQARRRRSRRSQIGDQIMALNAQQRRIVSLLATGLKAGQVASIVGLSAGYISQLMGDEGPEGFKEALAQATEEGQGKEGAEEEVISNKYLSLEHKVLKQVEDTLPFAEFPQLVNALKVIGERQEKRAARKAGLIMARQAGQMQQNITVLMMPAHTVPEYQVNGQGQVLAIEGRGMNPLSAGGVKALFQQKRAEKHGVELVAVEELQALGQELKEIDHVEGRTEQSFG